MLTHTKFARTTFVVHTIGQHDNFAQVPGTECRAFVLALNAKGQHVMARECQAKEINPALHFANAEAYFAWVPKPAVTVVDVAPHSSLMDKLSEESAAMHVAALGVMAADVEETPEYRGLAAAALARIAKADKRSAAAKKAAATRKANKAAKAA